VIVRDSESKLIKRERESKIKGIISKIDENRFTEKPEIEPFGGILNTASELCV
jgi:hypothetical protein